MKILNPPPTQEQIRRKCKWAVGKKVKCKDCGCKFEIESLNDLTDMTKEGTYAQCHCPECYATNDFLRPIWILW